MKTISWVLLFAACVVVAGCQGSATPEPLPAEKVVEAPADAPVNADGSDPR